MVMDVIWLYCIVSCRCLCTCSLLMLVKDARSDHIEEAYSRGSLKTALYVAMSVSFCLPHPVAVSALLFVEASVRVLRWCECVYCM